LKPAPRLEFAHQLIVTVGGDSFEVHATRDGHWFLDSVPDTLAPSGD
jgi:hypothetical protein